MLEINIPGIAVLSLGFLPDTPDEALNALGIVELRHPTLKGGRARSLR